MEKDIIIAISEEIGTPFYIYDYDKIKSKFNELKESLTHFAHIYYSVKANPSLGICQIMNHFTENAEVSSLGELYCVLEAGFQGDNILFSGPGKTKEALYVAIKHGIKISIESIYEVYLINTICNELNLSSNILIRINPDFMSSKNGIAISGLSSQFGVDISEMEIVLKKIRQVKTLHLIGFSIYLGSQILEAKDIIENTKKILELFFRLQEKHGLDLKEINLGGGFGISYYDDKELDLRQLKKGLKYLFEKYVDKLKDINIYFESGRFLIAESGSFITKVLYKKHLKGKDYLICDGGFNNVLIASFFTREIRGNFPIILLTKSKLADANIEMEYYISGPLCSPNDIIGSRVILTKVNEGDLLEIKKVGAYGLTYSPLLFISHASPAEILIKEEQYYVLRKKNDKDDLFYNQQILPSDFWIEE